MEPKTNMEIKFDHLRFANDEMLGRVAMPSWILKELEIEFEPRGGVTVARVTDGKGERTVGIALCMDTDNYCKKTGRTISLGRALKNGTKST